MLRLILPTALIVSFASQPLFADGGILIPITYASHAKVSADTQKALLIWNDGRETLHVRSSYHGPTTDFAWIVPVPKAYATKQPSKIEKIRAGSTFVSQPFNSLANLTRRLIQSFLTKLPAFLSN